MASTLLMCYLRNGTDYVLINTLGRNWSYLNTIEWNTYSSWPELIDKAHSCILKGLPVYVDEF